MPRVVQSLDLFAPAPVEVPHAENRPTPSRSQLWIAVSLPSLALECLSAVGPREPAVVVEAEHGQLLVVASSRAAVDAGVVAGTKLSTALALSASLQVFERAASLEHASLESLASWGETLTSSVSLEAPESVLLEVAGSLRLFGSLEAIKARLSEELARRYRDFRFCTAPTATAALWLARAGSADVLQWQQLAGRLASLPLAVTRWPPAVQALLRDLGLRTVGDCVRLPRDGFARRVGRFYLAELDRAFGRSTDLRVEFKTPMTWSSSAELGEESVDSAVFIEAIEQLLDELLVELKMRQRKSGRSKSRSSICIGRPRSKASTCASRPTIGSACCTSSRIAWSAASCRCRPWRCDSARVLSGLSSSRTPACSRRSLSSNESSNCSSGCKSDSDRRRSMDYARLRSIVRKRLGQNGSRATVAERAELYRCPTERRGRCGYCRLPLRSRTAAALSSSARARSASRAVGGTSTTSLAITTPPKTATVRSCGCFAITALAVGSCMGCSAER